MKSAIRISLIFLYIGCVRFQKKKLFLIFHLSNIHSTLDEYIDK